MAVFVGGLVAAVVFYVFILCVGIWAGFKQKNTSEEEIMMAGRNIGLVVGVLTLTATWVGGAYINGVAECMFRSDVASCQMPVGFSLSLLIGCLLFIKPLRKGNYVTMLDPFQDKYGAKSGSLMFVPAFLADTIWAACVLNALGSSLTIILNVDMTTTVIVSAVFAAAYTVVGGLYSVSYTDVIQMFLVVIGLVVSVSFAYQNSYISQSELVEHDWVGYVKTSNIGTWIDGYLLLILGGTPGQAYVQRILSIRSTRTVQIVSVWAMFGCLAVAVPSALAGVAGRVADWENVPGFNRNITDGDAVNILPLVLRFLTPEWVACVGLGAIAAAAMSSADACMLSSSSMFARNIYKIAIRPKASELEVVWILRFFVVVVTVVSVSIALTVDSVYYLSILSTDLVYVILFPHLLFVVHWPESGNTYGFIFSFFLGTLLRILSGEPELGMQPVLHWPLYDEVEQVQMFPFKSACMLCTVAAHFGVSYMVRLCFERGWLSADRWDVLDDFPHCNDADLLMQMWPRRPSYPLHGTAGTYSHQNNAFDDGKALASRWPPATNGTSSAKS